MFLDHLFTNPYVTVFAVIALGMALGNLKLWDLSLGSSGVLFVALLFGHLGYSIPGGLGTVGMIIFAYCVGIGAGSRFFSVLARHGTSFALISLLVVVSAALVVDVSAIAFNLPSDLAAGLFAGAMTSTPALAAGLEEFNKQDSLITIGYGIAYPMGVIGVVIFVQLLPRLLRKDFNQLAEECESRSDEDARKVINVLARVTNPNLYGRRIADNDFFDHSGVAVSRIVRHDALVPLRYDDTFEEGTQVLVVGFDQTVAMAIDFLGERVDDHSLRLNADRERRQLTVTDPQVIGQSLRTLNTLRNYGVIVSRITRAELTFVPRTDTVIENNDVLTTVGNEDELTRFAEYVGHRSTAAYETDILSFAVGITAGVVLGLLPIGTPGGGTDGDTFALGLAGGPLFVGLLLGHFGRVGRIVGHIPRGTRLLLSELGLVLFLAAAGVQGGGQMMAALQEYGLIVFGVGAAVTIVPLLIALPVTMLLLKISALESLGSICGGMTSTPALGAITAKTDSQMPVVAYASAYPIALILMIILTKSLIGLLGVAG